MTTETKKFFGMREYVGVSDTGEKVPSGISIIEVLCADGTKLKTTQLFFDLMKSEVPLDASAFQALLIPKVIENIFGIFSDYNISVADLNVIMQRLPMAWNTTFNHAVNFGMGVDHIDHIDMLKINKLNDASEVAKKTTIQPVTPTGSSDAGNGETAEASTV